MGDLFAEVPRIQLHLGGFGAVLSQGGIAMQRLALTTLGSFHLTQGGKPIEGFESDKVRALLAYLAVESHTSHQRTTLANLLWSEFPERSARRNLSQALYNLRQTIETDATSPSYIVVNNRTIQFNLESDHDLDAQSFIRLASACDRHQHTVSQPCDDCMAKLERAIALYGGSFLAGFSLRDCPAFDEWSIQTRERLHRSMVTTLQLLADSYELRGDFEEASQYVHRLIALEPWNEASHRHYMELLAAGGQPGSALAHFEQCRQALADELGIEPSAETRTLLERIRQGVVPTPQPIQPIQEPAFLSRHPEVTTESAIFVARERELAQLDRFLDMAMGGSTQLAFVCGDAGRGKTAVVEEFIRRAQATHPQLLAVSDSCNAFTGIGDPYLPFRTMLALLTGDVEPRYAAGTLSPEQARRLWHALPLTTRTLVEIGPDLIDVLISLDGLLERVSTSNTNGEAWAHRLFARKQGNSDSVDHHVQQHDLFEQYTRVVQRVGQKYPLILVVDDLQWADLGSISLLFHLGRRLANSSVLIVGVYRAEELSLERTDGPYPLAQLLREFQRDFGDVTITLGMDESIDFVDKLIDARPNRLDATFRQRLFQQTQGHPLFTVELLRELQTRGSLVQDGQGRWQDRETVEWDILPARVEAVIAGRISRLSGRLQELLNVASVEGEVFTAEAIAVVLSMDERAVARQLETELGRQHRLVHIQNIDNVHGRRIARFRFQHGMFQTYLYARLGDAQRVYLHEEVGNALEKLYADAPETLVENLNDLARHFSEAGNAKKAIDYLRQAGERAIQLSAHEEAIGHLSNAIDMLAALPEDPVRARQEFSLQIQLASQLQIARGHGAPETADAHARAQELSRKVQEPQKHITALYLLWTYYLLRAELRAAMEIAEKIHSAFQSSDGTDCRITGYWALGVSLLNVGDFARARTLLEQMAELYEPQRHKALAFSHGMDPKVTALLWLARTLWYLGYPEQALQRSREASDHARAVSHPYSLVVALSMSAWVHQDCGHWEMAEQLAVEAIALSEEYGIPQIQGLATILLGRALAGRGIRADGLRRMRHGLALHQETGALLGDPGVLSWIVEAEKENWHDGRGLRVVSGAMMRVEESDEGLWRAELHRLRGEILLTQPGTEAQSETLALKCFVRAIEIAQSQAARSLELRATLSLCQLYRHQGRIEEALHILNKIVGWFSEGFHTRDLMAAQTLIKSLSESSTRTKV